MNCKKNDNICYVLIIGKHIFFFCYYKCFFFFLKVIVKITTQNATDTSWYGLAKYAWSGSVIECQNCGEIFRSRQYWYGNKTPEDIAVR